MSQTTGQGVHRSELEILGEHPAAPFPPRSSHAAMRRPTAGPAPGMSPARYQAVGGTSAPWDPPAVVRIRQVREGAAALRSRAGEPNLDSRPHPGRRSWMPWSEFRGCSDGSGGIPNASAASACDGGSSGSFNTLPMSSCYADPGVHDRRGDIHGDREITMTARPRAEKNLQTSASRARRVRLVTRRERTWTQ